MEYYNLQKDKNRKIFRKLLVIYIVLVLVKLFSSTYLAQIIVADKNAFETLVRNPLGAQESLSTNSTSKQKILVIKKFLMNKFSFAKFNFKSQDLMRGEIVLVRLDYAPIKKKKLGIISKLVYVLSIGMIRIDFSDYVLRRVEGLPGDTIVYSPRTLIAINGPSKEFFDQPSVERIPYFDSIKEITLNEKEYFLLGVGEFAIDDRLMGPTSINKIKGKAIMRAGHEWTFLDAKP